MILNDFKNNPGVRVIVIGALANLALAGLKIAGGILGRSTAMVADGVHSLSDLLTDGVVLFTHKIGQLPADENHPYGHGRAETIGATVVGAVIIAAGFGLAYDAWVTIDTEAFRAPGLLAAAAAVVSIAVNEILFRYTRKAGEQTRSPSLIANAWHHRSDAISSIAALLGIGAAMAGYPIMDPIAAVVVAVLVAKVGYDIVFSSLSDLMDTALSEEETVKIEQVINRIDGVIRSHNLRTRRIGSEVLMDVHVLVDREASVTEGHHIAESVRRKLIRRFDNIQEVLVHVDTEDDTDFETIYWVSRKDLCRQADPILASIPEVAERTQLRTHYHKGETLLEVYVKLKGGLTANQTLEVLSRLKGRLMNLDQVDDVRVYIDVN